MLRTNKHVRDAKKHRILYAVAIICYHKKRSRTHTLSHQYFEVGKEHKPYRYSPLSLLSLPMPFTSLDWYLSLFSPLSCHLLYACARLNVSPPPWTRKPVCIEQLCHTNA